MFLFFFSLNFFRVTISRTSFHAIIFFVHVTTLIYFAFIKVLPELQLYIFSGGLR